MIVIEDIKKGNRNKRWEGIEYVLSKEGGRSNTSSIRRSQDSFTPFKAIPNSVSLISRPPGQEASAENIRGHGLIF